MGLVVHPLVVAARTYHNVSARATVYHRGARLLADHILRESGAAWADTDDDKNMQQWGKTSEKFRATKTTKETV